MAQNKPDMQLWTNAWRKADQEIFKNVYAKNAIIFPPGKPSVKGNDNILNFMKGGLGKVDVVFEKDFWETDENIIFEHGTFKDVELASQQVIGIGNYAVLWVLSGANWRIINHTWTMPNKKL